MHQRILDRIATGLTRSFVLLLALMASAAVAHATPLESMQLRDRAVPSDERPLDLADGTPRPVRIRFEVSSADEPGRLDSIWSVARRAWLEPVPERGLVRVHVPAVVVEEQLRSTGTEPVDGSFSDFVWLIEPATGEVVEATLTGRVRESIRIGPIRTSALVQIDVAMSTRQAAGFQPDSGILGLRTNGICTPDPAAVVDEECVGVPAVRFDPTRGYLNAVGRVRAASTFATIDAFSPLGEIQITESGSRGTEKGGSGPPLSGAVRRAHVDR